MVLAIEQQSINRFIPVEQNLEPLVIDLHRRLNSTVKREGVAFCLLETKTKIKKETYK